MAAMGFRSLDEMIGRSDLFDMRRAVDHWKAQGLDLSAILYRPEVATDVADALRDRTRTTAWRRALDSSCYVLAGRRTRTRRSVCSRHARSATSNRTVGTMLGQRD